MEQEKVSNEVNETKSLTLWQETQSLGEVFAKSGMFPDVKSQNQAIVKILAGRELGLPPLISMTKIYMVLGKVTIGAELMAGLVKKSKEYDYKILHIDNLKCEIEFKKGNDILGTSVFTIDDAKKAGVFKQGGAWDKFPKNLLFARAMSNGCRFFCPHLISGACTPEELGMPVNETGEAETKPTKTVIEVNNNEVTETKTVLNEKGEVDGNKFFVVE